MTPLTEADLELIEADLNSPSQRGPTKSQALALVEQVRTLRDEAELFRSECVALRRQWEKTEKERYELQAALGRANDAVLKSASECIKAREERSEMHRRVQKTEGENKRLLKALNRIAYEPIGPSDASHQYVFYAVVDIARAALLGESDQ